MCVVLVVLQLYAHFIIILDMQMAYEVCLLRGSAMRVVLSGSATIAMRVVLVVVLLQLYAHSIKLLDMRTAHGVCLLRGSAMRVVLFVLQLYAHSIKLLDMQTAHGVCLLRGRGTHLRSITTLLIVLTIAMIVSNKCAEKSGRRFARRRRYATLIGERRYTLIKRLCLAILGVSD